MGPSDLSVVLGLCLLLAGPPSSASADSSPSSEKTKIEVCPSVNSTRPLRNPLQDDKCYENNQCPGSMKCCRIDYGRQCVRPIQVDAQDTCPAVKNQNCAGPGVDECKNDSQCPAPRKCCCSDCGWKCVIPVKVKVGRCPARDRTCRGENYPLCQSDIDCPGIQKCCNTCGKTCADPEPEPPGVCPVSEVPDVHQLQCSSVTCSSNEDCGPQWRCCLTEENQKCMKPQPEVLSICPSFSPEVCKMVKDAIDKCQNDSDCESPQKCCCSNCGRTCLAPVQVKPGRCPQIRSKCTDTNPQPRCQNDSDCPSNKKCCDICGRSCWAPDPEPFGSCPVTKDVAKPPCSAVLCSRDADCAADEKCCVSDNSQKCVQPYPVVQSACPRFNPVGCSSGKVRDDCIFDVQCPRNKKCCCTACGRKCVTPAQVKSGRCPNIPYMCLPSPPDPMCETDTDCPGEEKCCNICGFTCHAPEPEPLGVCPASQVKEKMLDCPSIRCTTDDDCGNRKKCCLSVDGKSCTLPVEELSPSGTLRVCPAFNTSACLPNKSYPNECQWDKDCQSSKKCCCSACSLKCTIPKEVKPGRCPRQTLNPQEILKAPKCKEDRDCPGDMKCCPGSRCWKTISEPPGTCKALSGTRNASCSFFTCTSHDDCHLLTKCCPTSNGQTCMFMDYGDFR